MHHDSEIEIRAPTFSATTSERRSPRHGEPVENLRGKRA